MYKKISAVKGFELQLGKNENPYDDYINEVVSKYNQKHIIKIPGLILPDVQNIIGSDADIVVAANAQDTGISVLEARTLSRVSRTRSKTSKTLSRTGSKTLSRKAKTPTGILSNSKSRTFTPKSPRLTKMSNISISSASTLSPRQARGQSRTGLTAQFQNFAL